MFNVILCIPRKMQYYNKRRGKNIIVANEQKQQQPSNNEQMRKVNPSILLNLHLN